MTKKSLLIALIAVCVVSSAATAQTVVNTKHDLSANVTGGQVCVFCHTPHSANGDAVFATHAPLWNQNMDDAAQDYGTYTSDTFDATDAVAVTRATYSSTLLCLSCHDGAVAPGSFYNAPNPEPNPAGLLPITGSALVGLSLADDHPVNFTYQSAIDGGDADLHPAATVAGLLDTAGRVQCASCHEPHDRGNGGLGGDANVNFMQDSLVGSALCLNCHTK